MSRFPWLSPLLFLAACTSDISKNAVYTPATDKAFIAMGVQSDIPDYDVEVYGFDPVTKRVVKSESVLLHGSTLGSLLLGPLASAVETQDRYRVSEIKPGTYVLMAFSYPVFRGTVTDCLNLGTIAFDIQPGAVNYVGDIVFHTGDHKVAYRGQNATDLQTDIDRRFPNLKVPIRNTPLKQTDYVLGRSLFGQPVCPGYYFD